MIESAEPVTWTTGLRRLRGGHYITLRIKPPPSEHSSPAGISCEIDAERVPGDWGEWSYRVARGRHYVTVASEPPVCLEVDVESRSKSDIEVQFTGFDAAPYVVLLARQPRHTILARVVGSAIGLGVMLMIALHIAAGRLIWIIVNG